MNLGVSLSPGLLCGHAASVHQTAMLLSGTDALLKRFRKAGCTYIELRSIRPTSTEQEIAEAVRIVQNAGLSLTVHGSLTDEPAELFWSRLEPALLAQPDLCVTVHSASSREKTLHLLLRLGEYARLHHPAARLALENNRSRKGDNIDLVECGGVSKTLDALNLPNVGACWDFGHFYWDHLAHPALLPDALPPDSFIKRAIHTHIHSVFSDTTHFPLTMGAIPLPEYLRALRCAGYTGVYNLEPEPERWADSTDAASEIILSLELLKTALSQTKEA